MTVVEHHSAEELQALFRQEREARLGQTAPEIAQGGVSRRAVQEWVRRYNGEGLDGLRTPAGQGREPILSESERQLLAERVEARPQAGNVCSLRGVDFQKFLDQFSRALAPNIHAALIWGGAGFHRAHDLKVPANVTLVPLPPYSPELNGIENLWHDLHSHCWSNRTYANYDELLDVASESWCRYCLDTDSIKSVCAKNYIPTRS